MSHCFRQFESVEVIMHRYSVTFLDGTMIEMQGRDLAEARMYALDEHPGKQVTDMWYLTSEVVTL